MNFTSLLWSEFLLQNHNIHKTFVVICQILKMLTFELKMVTFCCKIVNFLCFAYVDQKWSWNRHSLNSTQQLCVVKWWKLLNMKILVSHSDSCRSAGWGRSLCATCSLSVQVLFVFLKTGFIPTDKIWSGWGVQVWSVLLSVAFPGWGGPEQWSWASFKIHL